MHHRQTISHFQSIVNNLISDLETFQEDITAEADKLIHAQAPAGPAFSVTFQPSTDKPGKLAEAELVFHGGLLDGLKLIGFAVWQRRSSTVDGALNVTFPARQYVIGGERRAFALLRPVSDSNGKGVFLTTEKADILRAHILDSYRVWAQTQEAK